jgi:hypothetical protein
MIGFNMATRLKEVGLKWKKPQIGDIYCYPNKPLICGDRVFKTLEDVTPTLRVLEKDRKVGDWARVNAIWFPTMGQLLAELTEKGYIWKLDYDGGDYKPYTCATKLKIHPEHGWLGIPAYSPEEAVAEVLWTRMYMKKEGIK